MWKFCVILFISINTLFNSRMIRENIKIPDIKLKTIASSLFSCRNKIITIAIIIPNDEIFAMSIFSPKD